MSSKKDKQADPKDLRPLEAKTLKSIIDTLQFELEGRTVLDVFAGTGRFGQACLDRGARSATYVELSRKNAALLKKNYPECSVINKDTLEFLKTEKRKYSLVFADPPFRIWTEQYAAQLIPACAQVLENPGGILLVRYPKRVITSLAETVISSLGIQTWKQKTFGESVLWYFRATE